MFHIVGTNHDLQHDGTPCETSQENADRARARLRLWLRKLALEIIAQSTAPLLIAEELSQFYLDHKKAVSIAKSVAAELSLSHRFCDPDFDKRTALGLATRAANPVSPDLLRECYWLACLLDVVKHDDVLFICGAVHVRSFSSLLRNRGMAVRVRKKYFGKKLFEPVRSTPE
jgi:hypothetical protein